MISITRTSIACFSVFSFNFTSRAKVISNEKSRTNVAKFLVLHQTTLGGCNVVEVGITKLLPSNRTTLGGV